MKGGPWPGRKTRGPFGLLATAVLALFSACGSSGSTVPTPPVIHYGEDICEECGMITSEARFAAAYLASDGHGHIFDDIGDMLKSSINTQDQITAFFVHDYDHQDWIRAETAYFVQSNQLSTPMFSGVAAFELAEPATRLAGDLQGQVLTFDEVLALYRAGGPQPAVGGLTTE
jgi:copper chaperone NosL